MSDAPLRIYEPLKKVRARDRELRRGLRGFHPQRQELSRRTLSFVDGEWVYMPETADGDSHQ